MELLRRYAVFMVGLLVVSFGIALTTRAGMGASPVAAIPYSLSLIWPRLSLGNWTILFSFLLIAVQPLLLRKRTNWAELAVQAVLTFFFGYFIDFAMWCIRALAPQGYAAQWRLLVPGSAVIAFGAWIELVGDVAMLPGHAYVRALAQMLGQPYSRVSVWSDLSMTVIAGAMCLAAMGRLSGVREGTVAAAILVGLFVGQLKKRMTRAAAWLLGPAGQEN